MLPPRRLATLLEQAAQHQRDQCVYHNIGGDMAAPESFAMDHHCTRDMFPSHTVQVLSSIITNNISCLIFRF